MTECTCINSQLKANENDENNRKHLLTQLYDATAAAKLPAAAAYVEELLQRRCLMTEFATLAILLYMSLATSLYLQRHVY